MRLTLVVLSLVLALSLSACAREPAEVAPSQSDASGDSAGVGLHRSLSALVDGHAARLEEKCPLGDPAEKAVEPSALEAVVAHRKKAWEKALGGEEAARPFIRARMSGWPSRLHVEATTRLGSDQRFLWQLARDTWRGLDALRDRENGLPVDHVHFADDSRTREGYRIGDYASATNIGLYLIATVAASDLGFVSRAEALERVRQVLETLSQLETRNGFFFNFYDTTSLERTSNFVSFVDSSWLTAGLMIVRKAFAELSERCNGLIDAGDYGFFYDDDPGLMSHGYYVNTSLRSRYHYGALYAESRLGSLIAIGKGEVPEQHWFAMARTFPESCGWQTRRPRERKVKEVRGHRFAGGYHEWEGMRYVPSWGGSMFEALMPTLVLDEVRYAPNSLGRNDEVHVAVQRRYALEVLKYPVWGISPSTVPVGRGYAEYGVGVLGLAGYTAGAVTPHASALALGIAFEEAVANLRELAGRYDIYGEYGFYDAVEPLSGQVSRTYLLLDQAMIFIALANTLADGCIQRRFVSDSIVQKALPMLHDEDFLE